LELKMNKDQASLIRVIDVVSGTTIIDTQGAQALTFMFSHGATTTIALEDGNDSALADGAAVDANWLIGATAFTGDGVSALGYVGGKRYVKLTATNPVANTSIYAMFSHLSEAPYGTVV
jgi:hypothetical protein